MSCSNRSYLTIIILVILLIYFLKWYVNNSSNEPNNNHNKIEKQLISTILPPQNDIITEYDYRNINDPLQEPGRRASRYEIGPLAFNPHLNIPTRGYPDTFSLQGYLVDDKCPQDEPNKIIKLFGRQTYPTSYEWDYYVEINVANDKLKVDLNRQRREIYDDDSVFVPLLKRNYKVHLLKNNTLAYNPFFV